MYWQFLIFLIIQIISVQSQDCPNNGVISASGDKCYYFVATSLPFHEAEVVCGVFGTIPVTISSGFESNFILDTAHSRFPTAEYYIGLNDINNQSSWHWIDGSVVTYTNWASGFPQADSSKQCVVSQWSGKWINVDCLSFTAYIVCQSPIPEHSAKCIEPGQETISGCYHPVIVPQEYRNAETVCADFGGSLVEIVNLEEEKSLIEISKRRFHGEDYWVGVSDEFNSGTWQYVDGLPVNYTSWAPGFPQDNAEQRCVAARLLDGGWYNTECSNKRFPICQVPFYGGPENPWVYFFKTNFLYRGYQRVNASIDQLEQRCIQEGAHLASIHSFEENTFVAAIAGESDEIPTAIGVRFNDTKLRWYDGSPWDYEFWVSDADKAWGGHPCALMLQYGNSSYFQWANRYCYNVYTVNYVCKKSR